MGTIQDASERAKASRAMLEEVKVFDVDPADVYDFDHGRGMIQVRAWPNDMPASGEIALFGGRRWVVTRTDVPTPGGRAAWVGMRLGEPERGETTEERLKRLGVRSQLVLRLDVTDLTAEQVDYLSGELHAQAERSEGHPSVEVLACDLEVAG